MHEKMVFDPPADKGGRDTSHLPDPPESTRQTDFLDFEDAKEDEEHDFNPDSHEHLKEENLEANDSDDDYDDVHEEDVDHAHEEEVDHAAEEEVDHHVHEENHDERNLNEEKPFSMALDVDDADEQFKRDPKDEREVDFKDEEHDSGHHFSSALDDGSVEEVPPDEPVDDDNADEITERFPSVYCAPGFEGDEEDPPEAARSEGPPSTTRVYLNVYDLSITNTLCCHWIGCGQYHTGVVVFGTEHHFNPVGVEDYTPRNVINARWRTSVDRGTFTGTTGDVSVIIKDLKKEYRRNRYNMIFRNANHFSEDLLERLNGSELPNWINRVSNCATSCCKCCIPASVKKNVKAKDWIKHDPHKVQGIYGSNFIAR